MLRIAVSQVRATTCKVCSLVSQLQILFPWRVRFKASSNCIALVDSTRVWPAFVNFALAKLTSVESMQAVVVSARSSDRWRNSSSVAGPDMNVIVHMLNGLPVQYPAAEDDALRGGH